MILVTLPFEKVFEAIDSLGPFWSTVIYGLLIAGAAFLAYIKTFKLVEQGDQAMRLNRGKVACDKNGDPIILGPGLKMMIPFWQTIKIVSILDRTIDLETVPVKGNEKFEAYNVRSKLTVAISNIFYWQYGAQAIDARVAAIAQERLLLHVGKLVRQISGDDVEIQALEQFGSGPRKCFLDDVTSKLEENRLGGIAKDLNITLFMPVYEGWTPQALSGIGRAIHQPSGSDLSFLRVMMNGIWKLFIK